MSKIESEYHFLLVCPKFATLRRKYFPRYYCQWPTTNKFTSLLNSNNSRILNNVAKYIYFANLQRNDT